MYNNGNDKSLLFVTLTTIYKNIILIVFNVLPTIYRNIILIAFNFFFIAKLKVISNIGKKPSSLFYYAVISKFEILDHQKPDT